MKQTKKIYTFILLFFFVGYTFAQNCKFSKNETDKFTNAKVLYTEPVNLITGKIKQKKVYTIEKIEMQLKYNENSLALSLSFHFALGLTSLNTNNKIIILLSNGTKVELPCLQNIPSSQYKPNGLAIHSYDFGISQEDFLVLIESDIADIRVASSINPIDFSVNPDVKTSELFNCIKNNK
jgi:hypothetical protein